MIHKHNHGFTVVELVVVIAIALTLMGIAGSRMASWIPDQRLKSSTRNLQSAVQLARIESVRLNAEVCAEFDLGNNECLLCIETIKDGFCDPGQGDRLLKTVRLSPEIDLYNETVGLPGETFIHFNSRGIPSGTGQLHIKNDHGGYRGVTIGLTGISKMISSTDGAAWH